MSHPTDEQLAAAISRGVDDGSLIEVDDEFLARLGAETEQDTP